MRIPDSRDGGTAGPREVDVWSRQQFLDYWKREYKPGQHVTLIGPTRRGKTFISHQMLGQVISPELPAIILAGKPPGRDSTMEEAPDKLGLTVTKEWPPPVPVRFRRFWQRKVADSPRTNGFVLKPHHTMTDTDADDANLQHHFKKALVGAYSGKQQVIVVADETKLLYDLKLQKQHEAILTRGAPIVAIWSLLQRGRFVSYYAYDMPEHVLFFMDPDSANVRRYAEMVGGVDPQLIRDTMATLHTQETAKGETNSEAIYFRRSGSRLAIVKMD